MNKPFQFFNINREDRPFGDRAAEKDKLLDDCFIDLGYLNNILNGSQTLFAGPKGVGKSAIAKYLRNQKTHSTFVSDFNKQRFEGLFNLLHLENRSFSVLTILSEMLLYLSVFESLAGDNSLYFTSEWPEIEKCLNTFYIHITNKRLMQERKIEIDIPKIFSKFSLSEKIENISPTLIQFQAIISRLEKLLASIAIKNRHFIIVDNIDDDYGNVPSLDYNNGITALLTKIDHINTLHQNIKIVVFIRTDILDGLYGSNISKITGNAARISWGNTTAEAVENFSSMIQKRVNKLTTRQFSDKDGWTQLYEEIWDRANPPTVNLTPENILDMTQWRPRDIVEWLNSIHLHYSKLKSINTNNLVQAGYNSERAYSNYFLSELRDASHVEICQIVDFNNLISAWKTLRLINFNKSTWTKHMCKKLSISEIDSIKVLEILYNHGVIGIIREKNFQIWSYRGHHGEFDENATLLLHKGLYKNFGFQ